MALGCMAHYRETETSAQVPLRAMRPGSRRERPCSSAPFQAPAPPAPDAAMLGKWEGEGAELTNRRVCRLWLEIGKKPDEPGKYTGAATLNCTPALSLGAPKPDTPQAMLLARLNPLAATMSGEWEKDSIAFRIDRHLNAGDCAWSRFSVAKFGSQGNLSADIQDVCGGGSVLLRRSPVTASGEKTSEVRARGENRPARKGNDYGKHYGAFFIGEGKSAKGLFPAHAQQQPGQARIFRPRYDAQTL